LTSAICTFCFLYYFRKYPLEIVKSLFIITFNGELSLQLTIKIKKIKMGNFNIYSNSNPYGNFHLFITKLKSMK
jgi:hypothetical protein